MTTGKAVHEMQLSEFAIGNQVDALFVRVGERVVRLVLAPTDEGPSPTPQIQGLGFESSEELRQFVMLVCGRVVAGMLPDDVRAKLTQAADEAGKHL